MRGEVAGIVDGLCIGIAGKAMASGEEVGIGEVQRGGDQAGDIYSGTGAEHDAVGVDQEHATVGLQRAEDLAGVAADDAVEDGGAGGLLGETGDFVGLDAEVLPVDDGAGGVGDGEGVAAGGEAGLAVDDVAAHRVGVCLKGEQAAGGEQGEFEAVAVKVVGFVVDPGDVQDPQQAGAGALAFGFDQLRYRNPGIQRLGPDGAIDFVERMHVASLLPHTVRDRAKTLL